MLREVWLHIYKARHTYRSGEPPLAWVYAIARRVRVDNYRKRCCIEWREVAADVLPEFPAKALDLEKPLSFDELVAALPERSCSR